MAGLAGAAVAAMLWAAPDAAEADLGARPKPSLFAPAPAWLELAVEDAGYGDTLVAGRAGYVSGAFLVGVAVGWRLAAEPGWRDTLSLSLDARQRMGETEAGLQLWMGLNQASGGVRGGVRLRRRF